MISSSIVLGLIFCQAYANIFATSEIEKTSSTGIYEAPPIGNDIIGTTEVIHAKLNDTFRSIALRYDVTVLDLTIANPTVDSNHITVGQEILIPAARILPPEKYRNGIVINIPELRLYYFTPNHMVMSFPVALGRTGWHTPISDTSVIRKVKGPAWCPPASIRKHHHKKYGKILPKKVPAGKNNPLGDYAIYLKLPGYLIHGTNDPSSIGRLVSSGCIRMYNQDVAKLYAVVTPGTPVHLIYYPIKAGWQGQQLYLEVHPPIKHTKNVYQSYALNVKQVIAEIDRGNKLSLNFILINKIMKQRNGIPQIVGSVF